MKAYTVQRMDKFDYDFSVELRNEGCFDDKNKALKRAKEIYERMCREYKDEMLKYSNKDIYSDEYNGGLYVEEDPEYGYYEISFGYEEDYECHSVAVNEWEMED